MVPIDKVTGNVALIYKQFHALVIAKEIELGLHKVTLIISARMR